MPKELKKCVKDLEAQGKESSEAYAICSKSTGWVRAKGGWKNKKTGEFFKESFSSIKSFKQYLNEILLKSPVSELIAKRSIPLDINLMDRLGYSEKNTIAYHMCNERDLLFNYKNQGKNIHLSCFTKGAGDLLKLPSQPNIILKLKGTVVFQADNDLFTFVDKTGTRWIYLSEKSKGYKKIYFRLSGILRKILPIDISDKPNKKEQKEIKQYIESLPQKEQKEIYENYINELERYINSGGYKDIKEYIQGLTEFKYNEIVLTKWEILRVLGISSRSPNVEKQCAKLGLPYQEISTKDLKRIQEF